MRKSNLILLISALLLSGCNKVSYMTYDKDDGKYDTKLFYQNNGVIQGADPTVITVGDEYYIYFTNANGLTDCSYFQAYKSKDLNTFEDLGAVFVPNRNAWAIDSLWAPEVVYKDGLYYMYYSGYNIETRQMGLGVATSTSPAGPFKEYKGTLKNGKVVDETIMPIDLGFKAIDPCVFIDDDGKIYLYVSKDQVSKTSSIYGVELEDDMVSVKMDTLSETPLLYPDQDWENYTAGNRWNEAPYMYKHNGTYYLMYSANYYAYSSYAIGYATSSSPLGPFVKCKDNPLLEAYADWNFISGTGHNSIFESADKKELFIAYHSHVDVQNGGSIRKINFDRISFDKDENLVVSGPSTTPQPLISGASKYYNLLTLEPSITTTKAKGDVTLLTDGIINYSYDLIDDWEVTFDKGKISFEFENKMQIKAIMVYDSIDYNLSGGSFKVNGSCKAKFNPLYRFIDDLDYENKIPGSAGIIEFNNNFITNKVEISFDNKIAVSEIVILGKEA